MSNQDIIAKYIWSSDPGTNRSTSAGAFFLIAREFLGMYKSKGVVYGCAFEQDNYVKHIRVDNVQDLFRLQGSKYVQSNTSGIYKEVLADLRNGFYVLFSGTACQVAALYKFVGELDKNLYTIDVLCHGVPSPTLWKSYINGLESRYGGKISDIKFRNKSKNNRLGYILKFRVNSKNKTIYANESGYYTAFLEGTSLRPVCYECSFVGNHKYTDMTLADSNTKSFHPTQAISLVLIRTEKGKQLYDMICRLVESIEADYLLEQSINRKLVQATARPICRDAVYLNVETIIRDRVSYVKMAKNRLKAIIPISIKNTIRGKKLK